MYAQMPKKELFLDFLSVPDVYPEQALNKENYLFDTKVAETNANLLFDIFCKVSQYFNVSVRSKEQQQCKKYVLITILENCKYFTPHEKYYKENHNGLLVKRPGVHNKTQQNFQRLSNKN